MTNDDFQNNSLLWQIYQNYQASTNNTWCYIKVDWMGWDGMGWDGSPDGVKYRASTVLIANNQYLLTSLNNIFGSQV